MRKQFKSQFPAFNIQTIATDTTFSDRLWCYDGSSFVDKDSLVSDVYPMQFSKQFVNTLEDNVRFSGAMTKLISDYAQVEISNKV